MREGKELELAAKYICNLLDGLCPQVVENWRCPGACELETLPWQCWVEYFLARSADRERKKEQEETVARAA